MHAWALAITSSLNTTPQRLDRAIHRIPPTEECASCTLCRAARNFAYAKAELNTLGAGEAWEQMAHAARLERKGRFDEVPPPT